MLMKHTQYWCDRCGDEVPPDMIRIKNIQFRYPILPELHLCQFCEDSLKKWIASGKQYAKRKKEAKTKTK